MKPGRAALRAILERCGVGLTPGQIDQLWAYHGLLRAANPELNLTRIHNFENMVLKHYVDSLLVLKFEELPAPLVDMGSGPGLPGIPLKIARPEVPLILAEPRRARAEFLERVCEALGLTGIEVYAGKVGARFPRRVRGVITRAVATIAGTLQRVEPILEPGGRLLLMKGPDCDREIEEADREFPATFRRAADHHYTIPGTPHQRRLVVYQRTEVPREGPAPVRVFAGPTRAITSASNPAFKQARSLLSGPGIRKQGRALIAGTRPVGEILSRFPDRVEAWITPAEGPPPPSEAITWLRCAGELFRELDVAGTHGPLLLVKLPEMPRWDPSEPWPAGCTLLVPFQDPENVGAVIRSAAAFGVARVVLLKESAHPFHPKSARAAGTALFQVPLREGPSIRELDPSASPLIALSADGESLAAYAFPETFGLVPGVEGPGLPENLRAGQRLRIPIAPGVESLNAAASVAIALYEWRRDAPPVTPASGLPEPGGAAPAG
jgi:16S rRNA (guanine(527)-N(7))-methyltransferase RsmG